jgi:Flp pilus assembly protein TadG
MSARRLSTQILAKFRRDRKGATAVEFALIAGPFLMAILATMEVALVLWTGEVMEKAVASASRKIYTGEFQSDASNANKTSAELQTKVRDLVCAEVVALISCGDVKVDISDASSFSGATPPNPINSSKQYDTSSFKYTNIDARRIGIVTASYEYKTFFPPLSGTKLANGNRLIMATAAFRTEPYAN